MSYQHLNRFKAHASTALAPNERLLAWHFAYEIRTKTNYFSESLRRLAEELELDPNTIELDNIELDRALRPDGTAGKLPSMSLADFRIKLRNTPQWENTTAANESARTAATAIGRAFGYGV
jgi:hypothetical protein